MVAGSTRVSSPLMIGHMTSALPYFHRPLAKLVTGLNQNVVKVETAAAITFLERETLAQLHHAFYQNDDTYYAAHAHRAEACLGVHTRRSLRPPFFYCSGRTFSVSLRRARAQAFADECGCSRCDHVGRHLGQPDGLVVCAQRRARYVHCVHVPAPLSEARSMTMDPRAATSQLTSSSPLPRAGLRLVIAQGPRAHPRASRSMAWSARCGHTATMTPSSLGHR